MRNNLLKMIAICWQPMVYGNEKGCDKNESIYGFRASE